MKKRLIIIGMWITLMFTAIKIFDQSYQKESEQAEMNVDISLSQKSIPVESGVFERSALAHTMIKEMNIPSQTKLSAYYENRAFHGAPPVIPHKLFSEKGIGELACLQCHQNGGYVNQLKAYAPVTPHPEMLNCKQCHVPKKTNSLFSSTNWNREAFSHVSNSALPGSPPVIPHQLQMREDCLTCHAGPSAPKEIRVSHPERSNCLQCHAINDRHAVQTKEWVRK